MLVLGADNRVLVLAGVFFRVFTQQAAQDLGVRGYVRNEPVRLSLCECG